MGRIATSSGGTHAAIATKSQKRQPCAVHGNMACRDPDRGQCFWLRGAFAVAVTKAAAAAAAGTKDGELVASRTVADIEAATSTAQHNAPMRRNPATRRARNRHHKAATVWRNRTSPLHNR